MSAADATTALVSGAVVLARLVVPLFIPRFPLPAIGAALIIDAADQSVFDLLGADDPEGYQTFDKALDVYYLTIAYASTIRNWGGGFAFGLGRALWYYRLVGVALFESIGARWLLLLFPNTFEYYFVVLEGIKVARNPFALTGRQLAAVAALIWIFIKLPQEWWLHIAGLDFTDFIKEHLFGVSADSPWSAAIEHRPEVLVAALVSLVTLIFSQILPGRRTTLQVIAGVTAVIAATTFISQWLARRGVTWRSIGIQFLAMGATNIGIGVVVSSILSGPRTRTPFGTFLFLTGLLTLIVVLFDRFGRTGWHPPRNHP